MQVLFLQNVAGTARKGDVKTVKEGHFKNYLLPRKLAIKATGDVIKQAEKMRQNEVIQKERLLEEAKEVAKKLDGLKVTITKKASGEKLYGSITEKEIINAIEEASKVKLEKSHVLLSEHIKTVGETEVPVKIIDGAEAKITVVIQGGK